MVWVSELRDYVILPLLPYLLQLMGKQEIYHCQARSRSIMFPSCELRTIMCMITICAGLGYWLFAQLRDLPVVSEPFLIYIY